MEANWDGLNIGKIESLGLYLGCKHEYREAKVDNRMIRSIEYNMEDFLVQCVERYKTLSGVQRLRGVVSPFLDEQSASRDVRAPSSPTSERNNEGAGQAGAVLEDSTKSVGKKKEKAKEPNDGEPKERK